MGQRNDRRGTALTRFDPVGPANEERHAMSALLQAGFPAAESTVAVVSVNSGVTLDPPGHIALRAINGTVVAGEGDDRVLLDAEVGDPAQQPADMMIEFNDENSVRPGAAGPDKFLVGDDRVMWRRHRVIEEERLVRPGAGCRLDEFAGPVRQRRDKAVHRVAIGNDVVVATAPLAVLVLRRQRREGGDDRGPVVLDECRWVHLRRSGGAKRVVEAVVTRPFQDA